MNPDQMVSNSKPTNDDGTSTLKKGRTVDPHAEAIKFVDEKKRIMKNSQYRQRFDELASEIDQNIINTFVSYGRKIYEKQGWGSMVIYNKMSNAAYDINVYPQKISDRDQNRSGVPVSQ